MSYYSYINKLVQPILCSTSTIVLCSTSILIYTNSITNQRLKCIENDVSSLQKHMKDNNKLQDVIHRDVRIISRKQS